MTDLPDQASDAARVPTPQTDQDAAGGSMASGAIAHATGEDGAENVPAGAPTLALAAGVAGDGGAGCGDAAQSVEVRPVAEVVAASVADGVASLAMGEAADEEEGQEGEEGEGTESGETDAQAQSADTHAGVSIKRRYVQYAPEEVIEIASAMAVDLVAHPGSRLLESFNRVQESMLAAGDRRSIRHWRVLAKRFNEPVYHALHALVARTKPDSEARRLGDETVSRIYAQMQKYRVFVPKMLAAGSMIPAAAAEPGASTSVGKAVMHGRKTAKSGGSSKPAEPQDRAGQSIGPDLIDGKSDAAAGQSVAPDALQWTDADGAGSAAVGEDDDIPGLDDAFVALSAFSQVAASECAQPLAATGATPTARAIAQLMFMMEQPGVMDHLVRVIARDAAATQQLVHALSGPLSEVISAEVARQVKAAGLALSDSSPIEPSSIGSTSGNRVLLVNLPPQVATSIADKLRGRATCRILCLGEDWQRLARESDFVILAEEQDSSARDEFERLCRRKKVIEHSPSGSISRLIDKLESEGYLIALQE